MSYREPQTKQNKMAVMPMGRLVFTMSLPMMVSLLIQSLYNIVDSIFVARLSEQALAAASLAYPVQMLMIAVGVGTAVGLNAVLSRTLGAGRSEEARMVATTGVALSFISALVFTVIGLLFAEKIAYAFTYDPEIGDMCARYLSICMIFCLGNLVCMSFQRLLQATGRTGLSMAVLVSGAVTNIALDPIMIFGLLGCPKLGIAGAAWATVIGQWVSMLVGFFLNARYNPEARLTLKGFSLRRKRILDIYRVGLPTIIMQAMTSMMVTCFNAILLPFSSTAVAFFGVYYKLQNFLFMPLNGLGQASIPIIGFNFGAENSRRIREALKAAYPASVLLALAGTLVFCLLPKPLLGMFAAGADMLAMGVPALRILSVSFVFASVTMITGYCASGLGDGITNMVGAFLRQFIPLIPAAYLIAAAGGIRFVWYAFWLSELCGTAYAVLRMRKLLKTRIPDLRPSSLPDGTAPHCDQRER